MAVSIIGAGNMARGIGTRLVAAGQSVTIFDRTPEKAEALASELRASAKEGATVTAAVAGATLQDEIVVAALYYPVELDVITQYRDQLAGKILIEISNPLNAEFNDLATTPGTSAAEEVAKIAPNTKVVKAFNTTFAGPLTQGSIAGQPLDVFLAGDDADAKARIAAILQAGGLRPLDVGPLKRAQQLEGLGLLHITQQFTLNTGFSSAVKILS
ncbi:MAG TPA: NAD(P)-binding domain-containing protein [Ktedonobacterales bacterium]